MSATPIHPLRAMAHPAFVAAVFLLIVNDHVLKHSSMGGAVTGKLSDFAGLFFAPVLLAALIRVRTMRGLWWSAGAVGVVFAAINVSPELAAAWDAFVSVVHPFHTTVDPTDLVALVAIPAGIVTFRAIMSEGTAPSARRLAEYAVLTCAAFGSIATSEPCTEDNGCIFIQDQEAQVSILNKTHELHVLRIRYPRSEVELDCETIRQDPNAYVKDAIFDAPLTWFVQSGQEIPVQPVETNRWGEVVPIETPACPVALVETDTAPDILITWDPSLPTKWFPFDAAVPREIPADPQTVVLDADYSDADPRDVLPWRSRSDCGERADLCDQTLLEPLAETPPGTRYFWRSQHDTPLHIERPTVDEGTLGDPPSQCIVPGPGEGLTWETPPRNVDYHVAEIEPGPDGCHRVRLRRRQMGSDMLAEPEMWWFCGPYDAIAWLAPQEDGSYTRIAISEITRDTATFTGGWEGLQIDATTSTEAGELVESRRMFVVRGAGVPEEVDLGFGFEPRDGCEPAEVACGQVALPADVTISQFGEVIAPGESLRLGEVVDIEMHLVRAEVRPVRDRACEQDVVSSLFPQNPEGLSGYIEAVFVTR